MHFEREMRQPVGTCGKGAAGMELRRAQRHEAGMCCQCVEDAIRLDTRAEDTAMQPIPDLEGFERCGLIQFGGGPKRADERAGEPRHKIRIITM